MLHRALLLGFLSACCVFHTTTGQETASDSEPVHHRVFDDSTIIIESSDGIDIRNGHSISTVPVRFAVDGQPVLGDGPACECCDCQSKVQSSAAGTKVDPYKGLFFENDFSHLANSCACDRSFFDSLKRMPLGSCWVVDAGGQYRMRYHHEHNIRNSAAVVNGLGLTGNDDDFLLHRTRLFVNAEYGSRFRVYGEMLDAVSEFESNALPRPIEENRYEMQNLFAELNGIGLGYGEVGVRVGRQEIALGAQRLISPLDWGNTRRTFEGARVQWTGSCWDIDGFWFRPLKRNNAHRTQLDAPNLDQQLYGLYGSYKGLQSDNFESYWLAIDYEDFPNGSTGSRFDTIGMRYWGGESSLLYELEGGVQFGENGDGTDHSAGFATAGIGRKLECVAFQPTVWLWYDWASGDNTPGNGFHHYEPLAHKYLGFMDLFGRRNIQDVSVQATAQLTQDTQILVWYHYFRLANQTDVPYNVVMTPFAGLGAGSSGSKDLGNELDVVLTTTLTARSKVLLGYSHFFSGNYYATTPGVPFNGDASFFYTQWHVNY